MYYVPLTQQAPQFNVTGAAITEAFAAVDIDVQICNGNATPTEIDGCLTQATQAEAAAIITDAIPYGMASNALDAAQAAGIPVVLNNNYETPEHPASETLQYGPDSAVDQLVGLFQWIALDSGGTGTVLFNEATDGSSALTAEEALDQAEEVLADGEIIVNEVSSSNSASSRRRRARRCCSIRRSATSSRSSRRTSSPRRPAWSRRVASPTPRVR